MEKNKSFCSTLLVFNGNERQIPVQCIQSRNLSPSESLPNILSSSISQHFDKDFRDQAISSFHFSNEQLALFIVLQYKNRHKEGAVSLQKNIAIKIENWSRNSAVLYELILGTRKQLLK